MKGNSDQKKRFSSSSSKRSAKNRNSKRSSQRDNIRDEYRLTDSGGLSRDDRIEQRDRRDYARSRHNDPAWYAQNAQLLTDYASFPYGYPIGTRTPITFSTPAFDASTAVPGAMVLNYIPTIGAAVNETSPINIAARNIYSYVRHANSGHSNYESPDLMMYLVAMDSVYMFHAWCKRLLGIVLDYSPLNRYYPAALIQAMGVDPDDLQSHIADFRGFINTYAVKIGSMCVPNSMSYMARHTWMTEGLYTDSTSAKAQTYFYNPIGYYKFDTSMNSQNVVVSQLLRVYFPGSPSSPATVDQIIQFGNELFTPIVVNEDLNIMSGDILKAFGADGVVKISGVLDGYMVLPVYNQEVLSQIENCTIMGFEIPADTTNIEAVQQDTSIGGGFLKSVEQFSKRVAGYTSGTVSAAIFNSVYGPSANALVNMHHDGVTPAETMVATRLITRVAGSTSGSAGYITTSIGACGSEIVTSAYIVQYTGTAATWAPKFTAIETGLLMPVTVDSIQITVAEVASALATMALLSNFDWHPLVLPGVAYQATNGNYGVQFSTMGLLDVDNYAILAYKNIDDLHTTALLSEFSVPQMGAFSKKI